MNDTELMVIIIITLILSTICFYFKVSYATVVLVGFIFGYLAGIYDAYKKEK